MKWKYMLGHNDVQSVYFWGKGTDMITKEQRYCLLSTPELPVCCVVSSILFNHIMDQSSTSLSGVFKMFPYSKNFCWSTSLPNSCSSLLMDLFVSLSYSPHPGPQKLSSREVQPEIKKSCTKMYWCQERKIESNSGWDPDTPGCKEGSSWHLTFWHLISSSQQPPFSHPSNDYQHL